MKPSDFYLCYLKVLSQPELDLVHAYWQFGDTLDVYKYKTNDYRFSVRTSAIPNIAMNIGKYAYLASKHIGCNVCGEKFQVLSRGKLQKLLDTRPEKCANCLKAQINEVAADLLEKLTKCLYEFDLPTGETNVSFNYLDALFTFILLSEYFDYDSGFLVNLNNLNFTGSQEHDEQIFTDLLGKNIIYKIDESIFPRNSYLGESVQYLRRNYSSLNPENRANYDSFSSKLPVPGWYISKPSQFEDHSILMYFLYEEILSKEICLDDIKLLSELVNKTLLHKAYQLMPIVENEHRITVERSLKLEGILLYAIKQFPLTQVFNVLHYNGRITAADIHSKPHIYRKVHQRTYINNLENRFNMLENIDEEKRYKRNLPADMIDSKVEIFSSRYFLGDVMSWASLSGKEVVKHWLSAHNMPPDY